MPCEHHNGERFHGSFSQGLLKAIQAFSSIPGALTIARNGGAELTLKLLAIGFIEKETRTFAFTEVSETTDGKVHRLDTVFRCAEEGCGAELAVVEFKHNLAHGKQVHFIQSEQLAVRDRLIKLRNGNPERIYYYVHHIFELEARPNSVLGQLHNANAATTPYKHFQTNKDLGEVRKTIYELLGAPGYVSCEIKDANDSSASARLCCWLFKLTRNDLISSFQEG
jgi:hypothetical protein